MRATNGSLEDHDAFRAALRKADFESVRGPFRYNVNHVPIQNFYKQEVVRGADGKPRIATREAVLVQTKDAYYPKCKMSW